MDKVLARMYVCKAGRLYRFKDVHIRANGGLQQLSLYGVYRGGLLYVSKGGEVARRIRRFARTFDGSFS